MGRGGGSGGGGGPGGGGSKAVSGHGPAWEAYIGPANRSTKSNSTCTSIPFADTPTPALGSPCWILLCE